MFEVNEKKAVVEAIKNAGYRMGGKCYLKGKDGIPSRRSELYIVDLKKGFKVNVWSGYNMTGNDTLPDRKQEKNDCEYRVTDLSLDEIKALSKLSYDEKTAATPKADSKKATPKADSKKATPKADSKKATAAKKAANK